jgi:hypothetical protein
LIRVVVAGGDAEFLDRIQGDRQYRSKGVAGGLVIDVNAIKRNVALVAARTVYRSITRVLILYFGI